MLRVTKLIENVGATFKLFTIWVRAVGVPESLCRRDVFAEVGSLVGTF